MIIKIAFFNQYVDTDYLVKICKCKVLSATPCVSNKIRLRKLKNFYVTYHTDDFKSSIMDSCFGMLYELEIDDFDVFSIYHIQGSYLKEIEVSTIEVDNVDKFMNKDFIILEHDIKCMCFVAKVDNSNKIIYRNRQTKVNFSTKLLVNILKI